MTAHVAKLDSDYPLLLLRIICDDIPQRRNFLRGREMLEVAAGGDHVQLVTVDDLPAVLVCLTCDDEAHRREMLSEMATEEGNDSSSATRETKL